MTDRKHLKKRYRLDDLVQQCDPTADVPQELNAWDEAPEVGREAIQEASKNLRGMIRSTRAVSVYEMNAAVRTEASQHWDSWFGVAVYRYPKTLWRIVLSRPVIYRRSFLGVVLSWTAAFPTSLP